MTNTKFNVSQISRMIGKSRPTVLRHIAAKRISFSLDEKGNKLVEGSELTRVYGDQCDFSRADKKNNRSETKRHGNPGVGDADAIKSLQDQLIKKYADENEHLKETLEKALDNQNSFQKLIEANTSKGDRWQQLLESKLTSMEERHDRELTKLKRALHHERSKSLWEWLFGSRRKRATGR